jgi:hypothetical protein
MKMNDAYERDARAVAHSNFINAYKTVADDRRIFFGRFLDGRVVMASSRMNAPMSRALLAAFATAVVSDGAAFASQGPGGGIGTASHFTQTAMAVLVYGVVAIVVCVGLIGAVRRRR